MRQWKVGSLTLGLTLIFIGIIFIIGNTSDMALLGKLIKFWPIILILLGIEILVYSYSTEKNAERFKIDGTSIFMFFIIFILCVCFFIGNIVIDFTKDGVKFRGFYSLKYTHEIVTSYNDNGKKCLALFPQS